jgi:O-antigen ligase
MKTIAAVLLLLTVVFSVLAMWIPDLWVVSTANIAVFGIAGVLAIACAAGWEKLAVSPLLGLLTLVTLWGLLQLRTGDTVYAWRTEAAVLYWAANAAVFFAALQIFADPKIRRWFLYALVWFGFAVAVASAAQTLDPAQRVFWIFQPPKLIPQFGPFPYQNQYAAFVELLLPIALVRAMTDERRGLLHGLLVAVLYTSVIAAGSRMGFFLATAELLAIPLIVASRRRIPLRQLRVPAMVFVGMIAMLGAAAGPDTLAKKFAAPDPYAGRREYTEASIEMVKERPLLGFGLGTWSTVYPGYAQFDDGLLANQAHDDWAQWAAEGGLPFAALMLAVAIASTRMAFRTIWGLGVTAVFVHCTVDYPIQRTGVALTMFIVMAAVASVRGPDREHGRVSGSAVL